jgi:hypothetical protein
MSILTSFSKMFVDVMPTRLQLTGHNILSNKQHGFRPKLPTDVAKYQLASEILNGLNNKLLIDGIFCDLGKTFDCVNHKLLGSELEF